MLHVLPQRRRPLRRRSGKSNGSYSEQPGSNLSHHTCISIESQFVVWLCYGVRVLTSGIINRSPPNDSGLYDENYVRWSPAMPLDRHTHSRQILINGICVFFGVILITLCFVLLSMAYNNVKLCKEKEICTDSIHTKAKVYRIIAATVFMIGFALMSMFWWRLRSMRAVDDFRQRLVRIERMAGLDGSNFEHKYYGVLTDRTRNLG